MGVDMEWSESRRERSSEMKDDDYHMRDRWDGGHNDTEADKVEKSRDSSKHRNKDRSKGNRGEDKDHRNKDRERSKASDPSKDRERESRDMEIDGRLSSKDKRSREKVRVKDTDQDKYRDKDRKDRGKQKQREKDSEKENERGREKDRGKEKNRERERERERANDRERERDREKHKNRERERERESDRERDREVPDKEGKEKIKEKGEVDQDKEKSKERDRQSHRQRDASHEISKDVKKEDGLFGDYDAKHSASNHCKDDNGYHTEQKIQAAQSGSLPSTSKIEERISVMMEERFKKKSEGASEIMSWVSRSRKLEEKKNAEKEKVLQLSKNFEEQDNINQEEGNDEDALHDNPQLEGVKVLHGLDRVLEGGAVVLTLKDQSILTDGDINTEADMLENIEIGEQKRRDEAYRAAKKKPGIYEDKFNDQASSEKKILPQYDDPVVDEGIMLDASGRFTGEAEKKLDELRRRLQGESTKSQFEDLNATGKISSDYYTNEELLQFKKPKKKKSLRKKDKLDINALEAEAVAAGLGAGDLGSRKDGKMKAFRDEQEKFEAEMRSKAYQSAYAKADEASKALGQEQSVTVDAGDYDTPAFNDDDEDLRKSLERARKLALKKQEAEVSGPEAVARLAMSSPKYSSEVEENPVPGDSVENKVIFTEMEEFVWGLQLDEGVHKRDGEDVFMEEGVAPKSIDQEKNEDGGWKEVEETVVDENPPNDDKVEIAPDETIHEVAVGKGLSGALKLLKDRGTLKETVEWGGRNMDKKKSKLVGVHGEEGAKEIRIERLDEFGRSLTPKEAFRRLSHKFHGKGPGKMKQEKRIRQHEEELKIKQMKNADTPSSSVEKMREVQAKYKTPYLVLSGHVQPGQTSDPRSGFATVEKEVPGSLTPMLGDRKVEHFLGIKRKSEPGEMGPPKRPKS